MLHRSHRTTDGGVNPNAARMGDCDRARKDVPNDAHKISESTTAPTSSTSSQDDNCSFDCSQAAVLTRATQDKDDSGEEESATRVRGACRHGVEMQGDGEEDMRPGSPIQHRRVRGVAPPLPPLDLQRGTHDGAEDLSALHARGSAAKAATVEVPSIRQTLIPPMMVAAAEDTTTAQLLPQPLSCTMSARSGGGDDDDDDDGCDNDNGGDASPAQVSVSLPNSDSDNGVERDAAASRHAAARDSRERSAGEVPVAATSREALLGAGGDAAKEGTRSPVPVTLLGVNSDLRRKRIKKVSNYVLGPLLGEGAYGVVRDALDFSGERVTRCAVKMVVASAASLTPATGSQNNSRGAAADDTAQRPPSPPPGVLLAADGDVVVAGSPIATPTEAARDDTSGSAGPALHVGRRQRRGGGLKRCSKESFMQQAFELESVNLQRFHSKHIIRAMDIFTRHGKQYVVLPIAICSLEQLIVETGSVKERQQAEGMAQQRRDDRKAARKQKRREAKEARRSRQAQPSDDSAPPQQQQPLKPPRPAISIIGEGESFPEEEEEEEEHSLGSTTSSTSNSTTVTAARARGSLRPSLSVAWVSAADGTATPSALTSSPPPSAPTEAASDGRQLASADVAAAAATPASLLPAMLIKGIMFQLLSGLAYLHRQNLAHNDVKASNILLFESGTVKLTDLGGVGEYFTDKGTPMFAAPELCRSFFLVSDPDRSNSEGDVGDAPVDAKGCDMWCCGLVLYYLITGEVGPLPVHAELGRLAREKAADKDGQGDASLGHGLGNADSGNSPASRFLTRFQVYREIASQRAPLDFDGLPDLIIDPAAKGGPTTVDLVAKTAGVDPGAHANSGEAGERNVSSGSNGGTVDALANGQGRGSDGNHADRYPPNSVRHLLARLLETDPAKRITAAEALTHPWVTLTFKPSEKQKHKHKQQQQQTLSEKSGKTATKPPSREAMEEAIQRDVAKRVLQSRIVKQMIKKDQERHLQFVCDVANTLRIDPPPEVFRHNVGEPFDESEDEPLGRARHPPLHLPRGEREAGEASSLSSSPDEDQPPQHPPQHPASPLSTPLHARGGATARGPLGRGSDSRASGRVGPSTAGTAAVEGVVVSSYLPPQMPPGCVDASLFLPVEEEDYYEVKSGGKREFDVRALRDHPLKVHALKTYLFNVVLVQCGFRTGPDPAYSIHSIGSHLNNMLRRNLSSKSNLHALINSGGGGGSSGVSGLGDPLGGLGGSGPPAAATSAGTGAAPTMGSATAAGGHTYSTANDILPVQPPPANASAIMGSVVIQTNRQNSLQAHRGTSTHRRNVSPNGASGRGRGGRTGSSDRRNEAAAAETDNAMRESSKCFCGLV